MKKFFILFLIVVIFALFYLIFTGRFCHCSPVRCPPGSASPGSIYLPGIG